MKKVKPLTPSIKKLFQKSKTSKANKTSKASKASKARKVKVGKTSLKNNKKPKIKGGIDDIGVNISKFVNDKLFQFDFECNKNIDECVSDILKVIKTYNLDMNNVIKNLNLLIMYPDEKKGEIAKKILNKLGVETGKYQYELSNSPMLFNIVTSYINVWNNKCKKDINECVNNIYNFIIKWKQDLHSHNPDNADIIYNDLIIKLVDTLTKIKNQPSTTGLFFNIDVANKLLSKISNSQKLSGGDANASFLLEPEPELEYLPTSIFTNNLVTGGTPIPIINYQPQMNNIKKSSSGFIFGGCKLF